jgi:hypothetical protein
MTFGPRYAAAGWSLLTGPSPLHVGRKKDKHASKGEGIEVANGGSECSSMDTPICLVKSAQQRLIGAN